jgi:hypothetical protein
MKISRKKINKHNNSLKKKRKYILTGGVINDTNLKTIIENTIKKSLEASPMVENYYKQDLSYNNFFKAIASNNIKFERNPHGAGEITHMNNLFPINTSDKVIQKAIKNIAITNEYKNNSWKKYLLNEFGRCEGVRKFYKVPLSNLIKNYIEKSKENCIGNFKYILEYTNQEEILSFVPFDEGMYIFMNISEDLNNFDENDYIYFDKIINAHNYPLWNMSEYSRKNNSKSKYTRLQIFLPKNSPCFFSTTHVINFLANINTNDINTGEIDLNYNNINLIFSEVLVPLYKAKIIKKRTEIYTRTTNNYINTYYSRNSVDTDTDIEYNSTQYILELIAEEFIDFNSQIVLLPVAEKKVNDVTINYLTILNFIRINPESIGLDSHTEKFYYEFYAIYNNWIQNIKLNLDAFNEENLEKNLKITAKELFEHISKKNYPSGDDRSNHGVFNHMRSLSTGIYIYKTIKFNILKNIDPTEKFCMLIATYFVAIGRVGEENRDYGDRKLHMTNELLKQVYPINYNIFSILEGYRQNFHQLASAIMYINIIKPIIPLKYHSFLEKCGFAIQWYHNDEDDKIIKNNKNKKELELLEFLHYFISTPHYIDHCRGVWSTNICHEIPNKLFTYCSDNNVIKVIKKREIYFFAIKNMILTQFTKSNYKDNFEKLKKDISNAITETNCDTSKLCLGIIMQSDDNNNNDDAVNLGFENIWNILVVPEQEFAVIHNDGVPEREPLMKNQCFWISLLQWIKYKNYNYEDIINHKKLTVTKLKELANEINLDPNIIGNKYVNNEINQLEIIEVDGDGVYNRLNKLAERIGVYIQVFIYDTEKKRIILSKECRDQGLNNEKCKNQDSPYTYGDSKSENRILIVSYGNHFELITKLNESNFKYEAPFYKHHVKRKENYRIYYNNKGHLVNWEKLTPNEQNEIIKADKRAKEAAASARPRPRAKRQTAESGLELGEDRLAPQPQPLQPPQPPPQPPQPQPSQPPSGPPPSGPPPSGPPPSGPPPSGPQPQQSPQPPQPPQPQLPQLPPSGPPPQPPPAPTAPAPIAATAPLIPAPIPTAATAPPLLTPPPSVLTSAPATAPTSPAPTAVRVPPPNQTKKINTNTVSKLKQIKKLPPISSVKPPIPSAKPPILPPIPSAKPPTPSAQPPTLPSAKPSKPSIPLAKSPTPSAKPPTPSAKPPSISSNINRYLKEDITIDNEDNDFFDMIKSIGLISLGVAGIVFIL